MPTNFVEILRNLSVDHSDTLLAYPEIYNLIFSENAELSIEKFAALSYEKLCAFRQPKICDLMFPAEKAQMPFELFTTMSPDHIETLLQQEMMELIFNIDNTKKIISIENFSKLPIPHVRALRNGAIQNALFRLNYQDSVIIFAKFSELQARHAAALADLFIANLIFPHGVTFNNRVIILQKYIDMPASYIYSLKNENIRNLIFPLKEFNQLSYFHLLALQIQEVINLFFPENNTKLSFKTFTRLTNSHVNLLQYKEIRDLFFSADQAVKPMTIEEYADLSESQAEALYNIDIRNMIFTSENTEPVITLKVFAKFSDNHLSAMTFSEIQDLIFTAGQPKKLMTIDDFSNLSSSHANALINKHVRRLLMKIENTEPFMTLEEFVKLSPSHLSSIEVLEVRNLIFDSDNSRKVMTLKDFSNLSSTHADALKNDVIRALLFPVENARLAFQNFISLSETDIFLLQNSEFRKYIFPTHQTDSQIDPKQLFNLTENEEKSPNILLNEKIVTHILKEKSKNKFSEHLKTAVFFALYHEKLKHTQNHSSRKINTILSQIQPKRLRHRLQNIINKMGAYNLIPGNDKNLTIGIEIEYSNIPIAYKNLTEHVMSMIQKGWAHPGDPSVTSFGSGYSGEATTPIISNNEELSAAMLNITFLQAMGAEVNKTCGLHIHIGVKNTISTPDAFKKIDYTIQDNDYSCTAYQLEFIKQFIMIYKREEVKFNHIERDHNNQTMVISIDHQKIKRYDTLRNLMKYINQFSRYHEVNLLAFPKHGTIEVRRFAGTTKETEIYATVAMITAIVDEAKSKTNSIFNTGLLEIKSDINNEKYDHYSQVLFKKQITEQKRELFTLRVKHLHGSELTTNTSDLNAIQISANDNGIQYQVYKQNKWLTNGTIENDPRFQPIINKLKSHIPLGKKEKDSILVEIAKRGDALISNRTETIKELLKDEPMRLPRKQKLPK